MWKDFILIQSPPPPSPTLIVVQYGMVQFRALYILNGFQAIFAIKNKIQLHQSIKSVAVTLSLSQAQFT